MEVQEAPEAIPRVASLTAHRAVLHTQAHRRVIQEVPNLDPQVFRAELAVHLSSTDVA